MLSKGIRPIEIQEQPAVVGLARYDKRAVGRKGEALYVVIGPIISKKHFPSCAVEDA